ncbi:hypothetical protein [Tunicatimonas pelagia]|uniref:hypothetical protein n=1 Tax=Tunicatimonas pelagia TaxID=931531 RepID=UPI00266683BF|nr:hypothetical protein [Tunicatimonas pelagia]WKN46523.1 hypothetical protein P0M28_30910 [Tunicatimonas pelagia]
MAYTLRLDSTTDKKLKRVMKLVNVSTATRAIKLMISVYERDQKEILALRNKTNKLENELDSIKRLYQQRERYDYELKAILSD